MQDTEEKYLLETAMGEIMPMKGVHLAEIKIGNKTLQKEEWDSHVDTAQWTKRLILNISQWITCKFRNTNYFFTQALTGHGSFTTYTHRIAKTVNNRCRYCGDTDTPEHTLFSCIRWEVRRGAVKVYLGEDITPDNIIIRMCQSKEKWDAGFNFIIKIMERKEQEERADQNRQ
ncbi:hypothetical protein NQ315_017533 [Exocentrus adspersus]|uniref:Reverse transcriptase n=1 Tax=Exocentrus adspersus TaxID=1586481 RepID=A0AAV8VKF1_9CUCU|nr:hypothetical protein NQ315_017533 [Exocentrus adspersus]